MSLGIYKALENLPISCEELGIDLPENRNS